MCMVAAGNADGDAGGANAALSADGRYVAFAAQADDLVAVTPVCRSRTKTSTVSFSSSASFRRHALCVRSTMESGSLRR